MRSAFAGRFVMIALAVILITGAALLSTTLGSDFLPAVDEGSYMLDYLAPAGSSLSETDSVARVLEQVLARSREVQAYTRRSGAESGLFATETNKGDIQVVLSPSNRRRRTIWQIMDEQRRIAVKLLPNADLDFKQILQDELSDLSGIESPITIKILGQDMLYRENSSHCRS